VASRLPRHDSTADARVPGIAARLARALGLESRRWLLDAATDPARFFRPPCVGSRGWVGVRIDRKPDWALVARLMEQAYRQVAPPRLLTSIAAPAPPTRRPRRG
jgi:hypothetical protein